MTEFIDVGVGVDVGIDACDETGSAGIEAVGRPSARAAIATASLVKRAYRRYRARQHGGVIVARLKR
jgi:hypothetical protein